MNKPLNVAVWLLAPAVLAAAACSTTPESSAPAEAATGEPATAMVGPGAAVQEPSDAEVQRAREQLSLQEQKKQLLIASYLDEARRAYADGRLSEAERMLLDALRLDPAHRESRLLLDEVYRAQGVATVSPDLGADDARVRLQARVEKLQAQTRAHYERGIRHLQAGEFEEAIGALRLAQANIKGTPFTLDWGDLPEQVSTALAKAEEDYKVALASRREEEKRATYERLQAEEAAAQAARKARLAAMLQQAIQAFEDEQYQEAVDLTAEILRLDPMNDQAMEIRDSANRARHGQVSERFKTERSERFRRWVEENEEAKIPYSEILRTPDPDEWARITALRAHYLDLGIESEVDPESAAIAEAARSTRIPGLQVEGETSLEAVIDRIRPYTDIPFVVTPDAIDAVDSEGVEFNLKLNHPISVENALQVITDQAGSGVTFAYRHGVVYITSTEKAMGRLVSKAHDVQDLTQQVTDFSGPKIEQIRLPDAVGTGLEEEEPVFGGAVGDLRPVMNPDNLETLIQRSIAPQTWVEMEDVSIRYQNGFLFVRHTPAVQRQIAAFLDELRRYISAMVTIEARFLTISKDYLQEIGVDFRGLGGTFSPPTTLANLDDVTSGLEDNASRGFDNSGDGSPDTNPSAGAFFDEGLDGDIRGRTENILGPYGGRMSATGGLTMQFVFLDDTQTSLILRAVEKTNRAQELTSFTISAQNTHRAYITVLNQITYVQDMDVEVAQAALIADPQVGVVSDGIVLDVRPTISHDRRYITLDLRPTVATLLRPIPEFTSSLAGLTTPVTLQLPELQVASAKTTVQVPDGGTVVIGGLKKILNMEQRAEVPFLARIPILSMLFKAEGEVDENRDVIILIRAHITDAREVMARQEAQN